MQMTNEAAEFLTTQKMNDKTHNPTLFHALIPVVFLLFLLTFNVIIFGDATLDGANQIALILAASIAGIISIRLGVTWATIRETIIQTISSAMPSMIILLMIGALAGTWLISGIVPAMIYYGLQILHPSIFLFASVVICALVSLATGSSWSTVATIGIALIGIGKALTINEGLVAGAIISGAYFGDKMSPLSDTTNLAPAMAGTDLFTHIRYMVYTTVPSISITLVVFFIIGFTYNFQIVDTDIANVLSAIQNKFFIHPVLFIVPAVLIYIIIRKAPPLPALLAGSLLGALFAVIFQPHIISELAGNTDNYWSASYTSVLKAMYGDVKIVTKDETVNGLLQTGGMSGMLNTIWLILSAMIFGGIMQSSGLLRRITLPIIKKARTTGSLVASTAATCIFFNFTASDQYIAIVVPGKMFASTYKQRKLKPEVLSRTLEDAGTVTSVLIPWNSCGATQSSVLNVPTVAYLPYAFFNLLSPLATILFAYLNIKIRRYTK